MTGAIGNGQDTVHTYCRYCVAQCGITATVDRSTNRVLRITPDKQNPYSWHDFCAKGRTAAELVDHPRRITAPMRRVRGTYVEVPYEEAIPEIAAELNRIIDRHGSDAVGSYHGNPNGFSLANTIFFPGLLDAIGTGNRFWVGSIDQNNAHVVAEELFGSPLVSLQTDIDDCDCFLLVGTNPAVSAMNWLNNSPDGWRRIRQRQAAGADLIIVDPRRSESAQHADTHLPVRPGQDWALLLGMIKVILDSGWDRPSSALPLTGHAAIKELARSADLDDLALRCGIPAGDIADVARRFATARTSLCTTQTGVAQTANGTVGEWLGMVLNALCDRLDTPGGRRFERGYVDLIRLFESIASPTTHRTRLLGRPAIAGHHSLTELAAEITTPGEGQIRAMLIQAGNPVVSGPHGTALDEALASLELLVAVDVVQRESHRHAHWLLPGTHWLERGELHAVFGGIQERPFVQYAWKAVDAPETVRPEWEVFVDLCLAMGRNLFGRKGVNRFIRASRALARSTGRDGLAFQPSWIEHLLLWSGRRLRMRSIKARPHGWLYGTKRYGDLARAIRTADGRVDMAVPAFLDRARTLLASPVPAPPDDRPYVLSNRRHKDSMNSWLMDLPGLHRRDDGNVLEVHPDDAMSMGLEDGDLARVSSRVAEIRLPVRVTDAVGPGVVSTQHGWGSGTFDPRGEGGPIREGTNRNLLTPSDHADPLSQTSAFNDTYVAVERDPGEPRESDLAREAVSPPG